MKIFSKNFLMSAPNSDPLIETNDSGQNKSNVPWFVAMIMLSFVSLTTGSINIFPNLKNDFVSQLGFSEQFAKFMLTIGATLMYVTLPTGIFMDKFGDALTLLISNIIMVVGYAVLFFIPSKVVFMIFFFVAAFGCSSCFISILQIALSRNPKLTGISVSLVSSSLSLAVGLLFKVYFAGSKVFKDTLQMKAGIKFLVIIVLMISVIGSTVAYLLFRGYKAPRPSSTSGISFSKSDVIRDYRLYILLFTMMLTVFDGMLVIEAASHIWSVFDPTYKDATNDWMLAFSLLNMCFTIILSALVNFVVNRWNYSTTRIVSVIWMILSFIPFVNSLVFKYAKSRAVFGVFYSMQGIPFGFGLTMVPAMTSEIFGSNMYGFAFGIVQFGSIASTLSTMYIMDPLQKSGISTVFIFVGILHVLIGSVLFFIQKRNSYTAINGKSNQIDVNLP